jgi:hypothetical protein
MRIQILILTAVAAMAAAPVASKWVYFGSGHRLEYRADQRGNRIMDFSYAGYRGGGVRLPDERVARTLGPVEGDNTARIQQALDAAAIAAPGAVLLAPGTFEVAGTLAISASGVVLRGSGSGRGGTAIKLTGAPHRFLQIRGAGRWEPAGRPVAITDAYVPSGSASFHVSDAAAFRAGDTVLINHPVTAAWIHFMGMDTLVRDGKPQTWIRAATVIRTDRVIRSIHGSEIALDVPLSDSLDAKFFDSTGASIVKYSFPGRISEVGVESLCVEAPGLDVPITSGQYTALQMDAAIDAWARDIEVQETENGIVIGPAAKRITLERVRVIHTLPHSGAAAPADFSISGTEVLLDRCVVDGEGTWPVVTQANVTGPIVVLNFSGTAHAGVSPHQRWATGLLVDGARLPNTVARTPAVAFSNRKTAGSGHGWDIGWAVAWNVTSPFLLVQQPPGAMNWCIGCTGEPVKKDDPAGIFDASGAAVDPPSLYLEQLRERLGDAALKNIGY